MMLSNPVWASPNTSITIVHSVSPFTRVSDIPNHPHPAVQTVRKTRSAVTTMSALQSRPGQQPGVQLPSIANLPCLYRQSLFVTVAKHVLLRSRRRSRQTIQSISQKRLHVAAACLKQTSLPPSHVPYYPTMSKLMKQSTPVPPPVHYPLGRAVVGLQRASSMRNRRASYLHQQPSKRMKTFFSLFQAHEGPR